MAASRIRAGDADRQQSVDRLARHFTDGRLDSGEYDERVRRAYASVYLDELPPLFSDLPAEPMSLDGYDRAWRQAHGSVDRSAHDWHGAAPSLVRGLRRMAVFALLAMVLLWIIVATHGIFFPIPLIWIGLFGLRAGHRSHRRSWHALVTHVASKSVDRGKAGQGRATSKQSVVPSGS